MWIFEGSTPRGSGVWVGTDLVLTARHVVLRPGVDVAQLRVRDKAATLEWEVEELDAALLRVVGLGRGSGRWRLATMPRSGAKAEVWGYARVVSRSMPLKAEQWSANLLTWQAGEANLDIPAAAADDWAGISGGPVVVNTGVVVAIVVVRCCGMKDQRLVAQPIDNLLANAAFRGHLGIVDADPALRARAERMVRDMLVKDRALADALVREPALYDPARPESLFEADALDVVSRLRACPSPHRFELVCAMIPYTHGLARPFPQGSHVLSATTHTMAEVLLAFEAGRPARFVDDPAEAYVVGDGYVAPPAFAGLPFHEGDLLQHIADTIGLHRSQAHRFDRARKAEPNDRGALLDEIDAVLDSEARSGRVYTMICDPERVTADLFEQVAGAVERRLRRLGVRALSGGKPDRAERALRVELDEAFRERT